VGRSLGIGHNFTTNFHPSPHARRSSRGARLFPEHIPMTQKITVIRGDGIGPEIMDATLYVLDRLDAGLEYEFADAGVAALEKHGDLMPKDTLD
jgi:isocitrate dehydrogenase